MHLLTRHVRSINPIWLKLIIAFKILLMHVIEYRHFRWSFIDFNAMKNSFDIWSSASAISYGGGESQ